MWEISHKEIFAYHFVGCSSVYDIVYCLQMYAGHRMAGWIGHTVVFYFDVTKYTIPTML